MKKVIKDFLLRKRFFKKGVKVLKNKKGFSLIEIMVGLGLLVIIGGIASTQYANYTTKAKNGTVNASLRAIESAVGVCIADGTTAVATCLNSTVNNSITEKKGFRINVKVAAPNTCFYVVEDDTAIGTSWTVPANLTAGKVFGRVGFTTTTGRKPAASVDKDARAAVATKLATGCAAGDH